MLIPLEAMEIFSCKKFIYILPKKLKCALSVTFEVLKMYIFWKL